MAQILQIIQIASSIALVALVLMQKATPDMGASLGGESSSFMQTRRGAERFLFILTILVAIIFVGSNVASLVLFR